MARLLKERGYAVTMTRDSDVFIDLDARAEVANRLRADAFVSIHSDSSTNAAARGFSVYVRRGASQRSRVLAQTVEKSLGAGSIADRGVHEADYRVLVESACPAILVELGFVSNRAEAALLRDPATQRRLAACIASGIATALPR